MVDSTDDIETRAGTPPADEPLLAAPPHWKGRRVGRYLVLDELGSGGMGEVYLAYDPQLDRRVALKLLRRDRGGGPDAQDRLLREAQAMAKLSHPNVVSVHDVGTVEDRDAGIERTVYVAMEYIEGPTLRAWAAHNRSWREIVAAYRAAGAGLAAAHRQGIVHRDFKPTNVIVGDDGRVRVLDFGLARRIGEPLLVDADLEESLDRSTDGHDAGRSSLLRSSLDVQLTRTGLVMGTPAYMAPEQFAGEEADRRGDIFSFCVALWEALYGQRPFAGDDAARIVRAVRAGRIREPGRNPGEPGRLRAVVRRGLAAKPADRPPDMDALLGELDRLLRPVPRGAIALGGAVLAAAVIIALSRGGAAAEDPVDPCAGARELLEGSWDGARKSAVAEAFAKTATSYAPDASATVTRAIDAWADAWVDARTEACVATRVRKDQSEELMDLRIACLDQRRADLTALVDVFARADADVVRNATQGAMALRPVDACADPQYLRAAVRPPDDPDVAEAVAHLEERLAAARALASAGKYTEGFPAAEAVLQAARPLGYDPLLAEAALTAGEAADRASKIEQVRDRLDEAVVAAARCGHARVEAEALAALAGYFGYREAKLDEAHRYARHAEAIAARIGNPAELLAGIAVREANAEVRAGKPQQAVPLFLRVLAMPDDTLLVRRQQQVAALNLSAAYGAGGQYEEASEALTDAIARLREDLGPRHPSYGIAVMNLGATEWKLGKLEEALAHLQEAEVVLREALGPQAIELGQVLHNRGVILREKGQLDAALSAYARALEIKREGLGPDSPSVALTANNVGSLLHDMGRDEEAEAHLVKAIEIMESTLGRTHPDIGYSLSTLGLVRLADGDTEAAIALFEEAIAVRAGVAGADETTGEARMGLARALAKTGSDLPRARELARQAHELFLSDPNATDARLEEAAALVRALGG